MDQRCKKNAVFELLLFMCHFKNQEKANAPNVDSTIRCWLDFREVENGWFGSYEEEEFKKRSWSDLVTVTSVSVIAHLMLTSPVYVGRPEELMMNSSLESRRRQSQMTVRWPVSPSLRSTTLNNSIAMSETEQSNLLFTGLILEKTSVRCFELYEGIIHSDTHVSVIQLFSNFKRF
jgi:hypothetical protein